MNAMIPIEPPESWTKLERKIPPAGCAQTRDG
jgi:hypothetical protein